MSAWVASFIIPLLARRTALQHLNGEVHTSMSHSHIIKSNRSTSCLELFLLNIRILSLLLQCEVDAVFFVEASSLSSFFFFNHCSLSLILLSCLDQQPMSSEDQTADSNTSPSHSLHLCCLHHRNHRRAYTWTMFSTSSCALAHWTVYREVGSIDLH